MGNEVTKISKELEAFTPISSEAAELWAEEMDGGEVEFPTVTTPGGGGTTWEIDGEEPTKEIVGVVVDDYEAHVLYMDAYTGDGNAPDAYWIAGDVQYISSRARAAGITPASSKDRSAVSENRLVLYIARPDQLVPLRVDLSGASVRPWQRFKQNQIVNKGHRVTAAAVGLSLEAKKYPSGHTGSVLLPRLIGFLDDSAAAGFYAQRDQIRPFTRTRSAPMTSGVGEDALDAAEAGSVAEFDKAFDASEVV